MQTPFDQRDNNFDFIRLALAILVIFSHSYPLGTGSELVEPFNFMTRHQVTGGHIAVDLFFIISGFLITASYERSGNITAYMKKRIFRIYPGFVVTMLFSLLVVLPLSGGYLPKSSGVSRVWDFVTQTVRLQEFHNAGSFAWNPIPGVVNGSLWSIQYEFWCYIGVALLGVSGVLRSNRMLLGLFYCSILTSYLFAIFEWTPGGKLLGVIFGYPPIWARLLPMYLAGMVFYRLRAHLSLKIIWIVVACGMLMVAAFLPHGWTLLFPIAGAYLVLALAYHPAIRLHSWSRYGDFSYGTYLYGYPVEQLAMRWIGHPVSSWTLFALATPATLVCAIVSWHVVEKRFLQRAHRPTVSKLVIMGITETGINQTD